MEIPFYQIDAFASRVFSGNPAGVCLLREWLPNDTLQAIAAENNLSETALHARQLSQRGGELFCADRGDRVSIGGRCTAYLSGTLTL